MSRQRRVSAGPKQLPQLLDAEMLHHHSHACLLVGYRQHNPLDSSRESPRPESITRKPYDCAEHANRQTDKRIVRSFTPRARAALLGHTLLAEVVPEI